MMCLAMFLHRKNPQFIGDLLNINILRKSNMAKKPAKKAAKKVAKKASPKAKPALKAAAKARLRHYAPKYIINSSSIFGNYIVIF